MDELTFQFAYADRIEQAYGGRLESAWLTAGDIMARQPLTPERVKELFLSVHTDEAQELHALYENNVYNTYTTPPQNN